MEYQIRGKEKDQSAPKNMLRAIHKQASIQKNRWHLTGLLSCDLPTLGFLLRQRVNVNQNQANGL